MTVLLLRGISSKLFQVVRIRPIGTNVSNVCPANLCAFVEEGPSHPVKSKRLTEHTGHCAAAAAVITAVAVAVAVAACLGRACSLLKAGKVASHQDAATPAATKGLPDRKRGA